MKRRDYERGPAAPLPTGTYRQNRDGTWSKAEPLPMQGPVARVEQWARARGWHRLAGLLARWDERNLGR